MKFSEMMKIINRMVNNGVRTINRSDVLHLFGRDDEQIADELIYLGCEVQRVADLFNVTFGEKFTKEEIKKQAEIERLYW